MFAHIAEEAEAEAKIRNSRLGEIHLPERARNEEGALHCVNVVRSTEYSILRSRKRRNFSESGGSVQSFPSGYDSFAPQHSRDLEGRQGGIGGLRQSDDQRSDG